MYTFRETTELETRFFKVRDRCLTVLRALFALAIPMTIVNISFACIYAWIYANQVSPCFIAVYVPLVTI